MARQRKVGVRWRGEQERVDARCRIEMLGGLRVRQGEREITRFRAQKYGGLLAYLAYFLPRRQPREVLVELFWPELGPEAQRNNLSRALTSLRRQLEPPGVACGAVIVADRFSVGLNPAAVTTDVREFEAALAAATRAADPTERERRLTQAVGLYGGPLLPGYYEEWVAPEQARLGEQYLQALCQLMRLAGTAGDWGRAIDHAQRVIGADPLREEAHRELMRLYAAAGQPSAGLRQYRELERILATEVGTTPSAGSRALAVELQRQIDLPSLDLKGDEGSPPLTPPDEPAAPASLGRSNAASSEESVSPVPSHPLPMPSLPLRLNRFFGREAELARLRELLVEQQARLVTLTGLGGGGKTRLAEAVVSQLAPTWNGAVWFVPLADLSEPQLILDTILAGLRLPRIPHLTPLEQVTDALSSRPSLLVLDNYEHLLEGAPVVRALLERVPTLQCLVTSRHCLGLEGEREFVVLPLRTPSLEIEGQQPAQAMTPDDLIRYESAQLFVDRAQMVRPDFQVTPACAPALALLCERLEGIPLAIELAAARVQVLTPSQMLAQLERRLEFLRSRRRDVVARHRTLRAAIDWGYRLLAPELQQFFARLSIFHGGWTVEAAQAVCQEPRALDGLQQLRDCSLILSDEAAGTMRFRMLETLREFAGEQLGVDERASLQRCHAEYFLAATEVQETELGGTVQHQRWLDRLEAERDNLRAALAWSLERDPELALRLVMGLGSFWQERGHYAEGREAFESALAHGAAAPLELRAHALACAGDLARDQGEFRDARRLIEASRGLWLELGIDKMRYELAWIMFMQGDYASARRMYEEEVGCMRQSGDNRRLANAYHGLATVVSAQGDGAEAARLFEKTMELNEVEVQRGARTVQHRRENRYRMACTIHNIGENRYRMGDHAGALAAFREAHAVYPRSYHRGSQAGGLIHLALPTYWLGGRDEGKALIRESLVATRQLGSLRVIVECLEGLAEIVSAEGQPERAARFLGAAQSVRERTGLYYRFMPQGGYDRLLATLRQTLGDDAFDAAWEAGRRLSWQQAADYALAE